MKTLFPKVSLKLRSLSHILSRDKGSNYLALARVGSSSEETSLDKHPVGQSDSSGEEKKKIDHFKANLFLERFIWPSWDRDS